METSRTDKKLLFKGLKTLIFALLSLFMGPTLLHVALSNPEKPLYMPILIFGSLISAFAVFLIFKGLKIILNSMFKRSN
jgi:hypothetical protein